MAFIFTTAQRPSAVIDVMRAADLSPVETRFSTDGAPNGSTGGSVGSPDRVGTIEGLVSALDSVREMYEVEPMIVGIRVRGDVGSSALGELSGDVHTRMLVPSPAAVVMAPPSVDDDTVNVVGGTICG
jgi:hypothetical protein